MPPLRKFRIGCPVKLPAIGVRTAVVMSGPWEPAPNRAASELELAADDIPGVNLSGFRETG